MDDKVQITTASFVNFLAGIWLIAAPFVLSYGLQAARTNDIILGVVVGVLALIRVYTPVQTAALSVVNIILGIWLVASPFVLRYTASIPTYNDIVLGIVVLAMTAWSVSVSSHYQKVSHA